MSDQPNVDAPAVSVSGSLLLYSNPEPLQYELHKDMGVSPVPDPFSFARGAHLIPLTFGEFPSAACCYPIIFAGEPKIPVVALGLTNEKNVFINADGGWADDLYIPAFIRRYPFVLADNPAEQKLTLCFDRASSYIQESKPEIPFFSGEELSDYAKSALETCKTYEQQHRLTKQAMTVLSSYDIFEVKSLTYQIPEQGNLDEAKQQSISYLGVDEKKFSELSDSKFCELRKQGLLNLIYGHLFSLSNWNRVINQAVRQQLA